MTQPAASRSAIRRFLESTRRGETIVAAAFAVAVGLLAVGAVALWRAGEHHRLTADEALTDQASYLAGMIAWTSQTEGWFATRPLLHAWDEVLQSNGPWPAADSVSSRSVREAMEPDYPQLKPSRFFVGDSAGWRTTEAKASATDPVLTVVAAHARDSLPTNGNFRMLVVPQGADTAVVFLMAEKPSRPGVRWYGFETTLPRFRDAVILPRLASLTESFRQLVDSMAHRPAKAVGLPLAISIVTYDHHVLYQTPDEPRGPWISTRTMAAFTSYISVSVEDAAVPILMQSGYPANRHAAIIGGFALGLLLLALAARLVARTLALSRQREEFTSSVSHELRTPLTNIQLFAETLLLERARTPDERRSALETITRETRRLVHMVENVLSISRIGRPAEMLVRRSERIDQLVRDVIFSFDPLMRSRDIRVELQFEGLETAYVDGDAVRRILVNLLDNAVRYGPVGQTLHVTAVNRTGHLDLAVEDEGPGIPANERERVWEPFERGSMGHDSGTGIGLAVVRQLVALHGGAARIEDGRRGARFVVDLPTPLGAPESAA